MHLLSGATLPTSYIYKDTNVTTQVPRNLTQQKTRAVGRYIGWYVSHHLSYPRYLSPTSQVTLVYIVKVVHGTYNRLIRYTLPPPSLLFTIRSSHTRLLLLYSDLFSSPASSTDHSPFTAIHLYRDPASQTLHRQGSRLHILELSCGVCVYIHPETSSSSVLYQK